MKRPPFDADAWINGLPLIPEGEVFTRCHRAVLAEYDRRKTLPAIREQADQMSRMFYSMPGHEKHDDVLVWQKPEFVGYAKGMRVWHNDQVWEQTSPDVATVEPGAADDYSWELVPTGEEQAPPGDPENHDE